MRFGESKHKLKNKRMCSKNTDLNMVDNHRMEIDLFESIRLLLNDCERYFPTRDRNMAENIVTRIEVVIECVSRINSRGMSKELNSVLSHLKFSSAHF